MRVSDLRLLLSEARTDSFYCAISLQQKKLPDIDVFYENHWILMNDENYKILMNNPRKKQNYYILMNFIARGNFF